MNAQLSTTLGYAQAVKNRRGRYSERFARLPAGLIDDAANATMARRRRPRRKFPNAFTRDFGPCTGPRSDGSSRKSAERAGFELAAAGAPPSTRSALAPEKSGLVAIIESPHQSTVLDAKSTPEAQPVDPDEALRSAIRAALDAGDLARVRKLVAVLEAGEVLAAGDTKPENVVRLAPRRRA